MVFLMQSKAVLKLFMGRLSQIFPVSCPLAWVLVLTKVDISSITLTEFKETDFFHLIFQWSLIKLRLVSPK